MRKPRITMAIAALLGAVAFGPAVAQADLFSFDFNDLNGAFTLAGGGYVLSVDSNSDGDLSRLTAPVDTDAIFDSDFSAHAFADFSLTMTVGAEYMLGGFTFADATGEFTITDADGDWISGDIAGTWVQLGGGAAASFFGTIFDVTNNNTFTSGTFDGPTSGSFSTDFSAFGPEPFEGFIVQLETEGWFDAGFTDPDASADGTVVPAPGALLLGVMGLGIVGWRKKRLAK